MDKTFLAGAAVAAILAITGCGGSSSSSSDGGTATRTAHFVDNAVTGLHYTCDSSSTKTTGEQGVLRCPDGATARFLIGDIELGEAVVNGNTVFITPADLAGEDADETDNTVINISRFLISLDADQDLANGIQIDPASHLDLGRAIDFSLEPLAFETAIGSALDMLTADLPGGPYPLVAEEDAQDHVVMALHLTNAGLYRGTVRHSPDTMNGMTFLVTREGAVYGSNRAIGIGENSDAPFVIGPAGEGLDGAPFGHFEGGPPSEQIENDVEYGDILVAEVVSTNDRTIRLLGMSMAGYLVDATIDLSGAEPKVDAVWEHIHEGRRGRAQTFVLAPDLEP